MASHPPQPCRHMLFARHARQVTMQLQKNVLCHFLRRAALAQNAERNREDPRLMTLNSGSEGLRRLIQCRASSAAVLAYTQLSAPDDAKSAGNLCFSELIALPASARRRSQPLPPARSRPRTRRDAQREICIVRAAAHYRMLPQRLAI